MKLRKTDLEELTYDGDEYYYFQNSIKTDVVYISFIAFDDTVLYLMWVNENDQWYIYHISVPCLDGD